MTNPTDLIERLRRTKTQHKVRPLLGGMLSEHDETETRETLINPDGPAAADHLAAQATEIARLREALDSISSMFEDWPSSRMALVRRRARAALKEQADELRADHFAGVGNMVGGR